MTVIFTLYICQMNAMTEQALGIVDFESIYIYIYIYKTDKNVKVATNGQIKTTCSGPPPG